MEIVDIAVKKSLAVSQLREERASAVKTVSSIRPPEIEIVRDLDKTYSFKSGQANWILVQDNYEFLNYYAWTHYIYTSFLVCVVMVETSIM